MVRIMLAIVAALALTPLLPGTAGAQDGDVCAVQEQHVALLEARIAGLEREVRRARTYRQGLARCRHRAGKLHEQLMTCQEELSRCTDPCADSTCQPWQECRVYEPTGEAFCADTCNGFECEAGSHCELTDVVCVRAPCPPVAQCVPDGVCELPPDVGPCDAIVPRWFHDAGTGQCQTFTWGGCGGNANNFESREACEGACPPADRCELPAEPGLCAAAIPRWYHDAFTDQCAMFTYGGCGGNANNFETYEECTGACPRSDRCELPAETGECTAAFLRYHFDGDTGSCEPFVWGGCGGNENRFDTLDDCMHACGLTP